MPKPNLHTTLLLLTFGSALHLFAQTAPPPVNPKITPPKEALGFNIGDDYHMADYTQLESYWKKIASECDRCKLVEIGRTAEDRPQYMMIISSPENIKKLAHYKEISQKLAHAEGLTDEQAHALAREGKPVIWIDGGLHASETVGSQQLMEMVYQMASRNDPETLHLLNDTIGLYVQANPDGQEFVAHWYMREQDEKKRSLQGLPKLYNKYIGHDDNRDFYMSNMPETTNMNRQMFIEWFPQIVYNHHQSGPAGAVIFMPPFRDPFNYNLDPLIPLGIEGVGTAMHSRLVAEGKGGSAMRTGANYSTWWNGGLRTIPYFHNMIGLLTEIIGDPTPMKVSLVAQKQLPTGDWPLPIAPQEWHYRQSIDYEMENNRAVLDYAAREHELLLYDLYRMGANSIEKGSRDNWTVTPKRIDAMLAASDEGKGPGKGGAAMSSSGDAMMSPGGLGMPTLPPDLYTKVLHDPAHRDPRGFIITADQADFPNATEFINALLKTGITVMRATSNFEVAGKSYPAGSYVIKTAQAFRPHVMDMFEPQDHPNDFKYPGGPPIPPYDITGWTLAMQMGVQYDRVLDAFDGPFEKLPMHPIEPPPGKILGASNPAGYLISHEVNNSFKLTNRLLKANADVYWLEKSVAVDGHELGTGTIWVPASSSALSVLKKSAAEFGINVYAMAKAPAGKGLKLKPIRIGLYDQYGGNMPTGWIRWLFEQYEFPFEMVYPKTLDAGNLRSKFDVIVFPDGSYHSGRGGRATGSAALFATHIPDDVPAEYQGWLGRISEETTIPQLKSFVESGGSVVTIGSGTGLGELLGVPVSNYLTEQGPDGKKRPLPAEKLYIPGTLLKAKIDNTAPLAFGMQPEAIMMFENDPVFKLEPDAEQKKTTAVGWFSGPNIVASGWAWGKQYLDGGTAVATASVGEGSVTLIGPEVTFRGQPHGTFKLLFNGMYTGSATPKTIE